MNHLEYLYSLEQFGIKFGLDNIRAILDGLAHPEDAFESVHVAGTNGKGSVTAMVETGLRAAGHRTGRYTSPHLVELRERFVVDGAPADQNAMVDCIGAVRRVVESKLQDGALEVHPTFFEVTTAAAFELFRRAGVQVAAVEVGLGGRLDATNVLSPMACAITSIAFDHELYLGRTLHDIALEKAGIIKPGIPVVIGEMAPEARSAIERAARERGAPLVAATEAEIAGRAVALRGRHQRINAAIALRLLDLVRSRGYSMPAAALNAAVERTTWPGRLDLRVLEDGRRLLMDAAHNPAGAAALAAYLREEGIRPPLVFAAMRDKDVEGMLRALLPAVPRIVVTRASHSRSAEPDALAEVARAVDPSVSIVVEPSLAAALELAWRDAPLLLAAGSIFLLGDVMKHLGLH